MSIRKNWETSEKTRGQITISNKERPSTSSNGRVSILFLISVYQLHLSISLMVYLFSSKLEPYHQKFSLTSHMPFLTWPNNLSHRRAFLMISSQHTSSFLTNSSLIIPMILCFPYLMLSFIHFSVSREKRFHIHT